MKNLKTIFVVILLASFILIGCGGNSSNKSNNNSNTSSGSNKTKMTHRCGRTWNGERDKTYGVYGDYCCERCYVDFYPN
jgi:hypothetical protein